MDRFFSKLDLRDIKIKPEGSRFLPDDEEVDVNDEPAVASISVEDETIELIEDTAPASFEDPDANGHMISATYERIEIETWQATVEAAPVEAPIRDYPAAKRC